MIYGYIANLWSKRIVVGWERYLESKRFSRVYCERLTPRRKLSTTVQHITSITHHSLNSIGFETFVQASIIVHILKSYDNNKQKGRRYFLFCPFCIAASHREDNGVQHNWMGCFWPVKCWGGLRNDCEEQSRYESTQTNTRRVSSTTQCYWCLSR